MSVSFNSSNNSILQSLLFIHLFLYLYTNSSLHVALRYSSLPIYVYTKSSINIYHFNINHAVIFCLIRYHRTSPGKESCRNITRSQSYWGGVFFHHDFQLVFRLDCKITLKKLNQYFIPFTLSHQFTHLPQIFGQNIISLHQIEEYANTQALIKINIYVLATDFPFKVWSKLKSQVSFHISCSVRTGSLMTTRPPSNVHRCFHHSTWPNNTCFQSDAISRYNVFKIGLCLLMFLSFCFYTLSYPKNKWIINITLLKQETTHISETQRRIMWQINHYPPSLHRCLYLLLLPTYTNTCMIDYVEIKKYICL